ncbi:MAG: hypothetical protein JSS35_11305, partial [Proteobacteria bacterium]|nr:hypothetical protein [Pseudomonadota bacterium]
IATGSFGGLGAQNASSYNLGGDFTSHRLPGLTASLNYFHIDYRDRIALPITVLTSALSDPAYASFVIRSPSAAIQAPYVNRATLFANNAGAPYDPAKVTALLLDYYQNVAAQTASGWDATVAYRLETEAGAFSAGLSGSWIDLTQRITAATPTQQVSGTIYNVPAFKGRATLSWTRGPLFAQLVTNFISGESDPAFHTRISSWTTEDLLARWTFADTNGAWRGASIEISVLNLFDRDPPNVNPAQNIYAGFAYDPANASPLGRAAAVTLRKVW